MLTRQLTTDALRVVLETSELEELTSLRRFRDEICLMHRVVHPLMLHFYLYELVRKVSLASEGENTMINILFDDMPGSDDATLVPWMIFADNQFSPQSSYLLLDNLGTVPIIDYERIMSVLVEFSGILHYVQKIYRAEEEEVEVEFNTPSEGIALLSVN